MDGPRDSYTELSKSEKERQILYINVCMWNLEKWNSWSYLQNRIKRHRWWEHQGLVGRGVWGCGEGMWDELGDWDWHIYIYTTDAMYKIDI